MDHSHGFDETLRDTSQQHVTYRRHDDTHG